MFCGNKIAPCHKDNVLTCLTHRYLRRSVLFKWEDAQRSNASTAVGLSVIRYSSDRGKLHAADEILNRLSRFATGNKIAVLCQTTGLLSVGLKKSRRYWFVLQ